MIKALLGTAGLLALIPFGAALADDASIPGATVSWTGVYVGGHVGYGQSDTHWKNEGGSPYSNPCAFCAITVPGENFSSDDAIAGGQVGYNYQIGPWVIGPEVSFSGTAFKDSHPVSPGAFFSPATTTISSKIDNILTVTGRLGYSVNNNVLVYAKGGYASADIAAKGIVSGCGGGCDFDTGGRADGWTAGAGIEYRLTNSISFAVEYAHLDFGDETLVGVIPLYSPFNQKLRISSDADTVTARLNLHPFN